MRYAYLLIALLFLPLFSLAQNQTVDKKKHKVVIQLTSNDTLVHKALIKQIRNVQAAAPNTKIEVVCHNNGITFLQTAVSKQCPAIVECKQTGVDFVACENTMRERKIKREELTAACRTVPAGLVEIIDKQEKGWAYVKAGF
ncbi:MAG: DsrE family protein [Thermoanaerobaculia bacterium]|nr:DsrE family protein [Thermoanaerobaculia bacterium]